MAALNGLLLQHLVEPEDVVHVRELLASFEIRDGARLCSPLRVTMCLLLSWRARALRATPAQRAAVDGERFTSPPVLCYNPCRISAWRRSCMVEKTIELTGSSATSIEEAVSLAVARAAVTINGIYQVQLTDIIAQVGGWHGGALESED